MTNYCVVEIKDGKRAMTGFTESVEVFVEELELIHNSATLVYDVDLKLVESDTTYSDGLYILINGSSINLIKKSNVVDEGYFWNGSKSQIDVISSWDLIESTFEKPTNKSVLEQFDLDQLKNYPFINIVGKAVSGKSTMVADLLSYFASDNVLIVSHCEDTEQFYTNRFPKATIIDEYNDQVVGAYLDEKPGVIVIDNCLNHGNGWLQKSNLVELFRNNKKYNKTVIITMQYPLTLNEEIRSKFDAIFLFNETSYIRRKRLFQYYGKQFLVHKVFEDSLSTLYNTDRFECMVLTKDKKKEVYKYKAKKVPMRIKIVATNNDLKYKMD